MSMTLRQGNMTLGDIAFDRRAVCQAKSIAPFRRQPESSPHFMRKQGVLCPTIDHELDGEPITLRPAQFTPDKSDSHLSFLVFVAQNVRVSHSLKPRFSAIRIPKHKCSNVH